MSETNLTTTEDAAEKAAELSEGRVVSGPSNGEVKEINAVDDDHPLVAETGSDALKTQTESGAGEFLSDFIYEHDSAWVREWLQNHETACVRAAKLLIRISDEYEDGWLKNTMWIEKSTGDTVIDYDDPQSCLADYDGNAFDLRKVEVPRPIDEVLEAARSLGYDPTIVWDIYKDERKIITEDNGIGMTPREFDVAFNTIFNSGSGVDGETGGMFGVGSESSALVHGKNGGAEVETYSRRPGDHDGFRAYSYLGGANALPGEVDEDFRGTRFIMPVQESFDLSNLQEWVENYVQKLRVPVLYREHDAGTTLVEEEYEATYFMDDYNDPPIQIERPGEFSVVAGPNCVDTSYHSDDDDTFMVSMPIDRNAKTSINSFWTVAIQIHDEQGRIVAGPNRGRYSDGDQVFETVNKNEPIGKLEDGDVMLPQPTGDRDRLQRDSESEAFFKYVSNLVQTAELNQVSEIAEEMKEAEHPGHAVQGNRSDWKLFKKMIGSHGPYRVFEHSSKFKDFVNDRDEFPDYDNETVNQIWSLFSEIERCTNGASASTKTSRRPEKELGEFLGMIDSDKKVYMAASTGGKFTDRFRVVENTYPNVEIIVINSASKYDEWGGHFGFKILKEVPIKNKEDEDHEYDIPDDVHDRNVKTESKGKPDEVLNRALKIRCDDDNSSIDLRLSIEKAQERLEKGGRFGNHKQLVLFPRTIDENISDNYDMAKYAAIASVSKTEYEELADYDNVMLPSEFAEWSRSTPIATEEGAMTPHDLIEDNRMVVVAYHDSKHVVKLLKDENKELRTLYAKDVRDQLQWTRILDDYDYGYSGDDESDVKESDKHDVLFAVAANSVLKRAEYAFDDIRSEDQDIIGLKLNYSKYAYGRPFNWRTLDGAAKLYKLMVRTPNWENNSSVYDMIPRDHDSIKAQAMLGLHDRNIDPSNFDPDELREIIAGKSP